ncbi:hypothetical protein AB0N09_21690 [Streptomyces erythrochromogenes]|uniref:hypothetical protein n=1 Tax=Streptomyces erythrochromogenes TaxID=285574 RepID=UPI0034491212
MHGSVARPLRRTNPVDSDAITGLWATARIGETDLAFPKYGTSAWAALKPDDPRRLASALYAAEMWRRYGDEEGLVEWLRETSRRHFYAAEAPAPFRPRPPHRLRATPGWPPIRVPGQPGRYLTYVDLQKAA